MQADQDVPDVLVVGAGIGGLTLALQLHHWGIACRVVEAAPELTALGVGINLLPHAARELHDLGLGPALDAVAVRTAESHYYNRFGQLIHREELGEAAGYPVPQYSIHRGDLQLLLLDAVTERLGPGAVRLGATLVDASQDERQVRATIATVDGGTEVLAAGVVVGCDGVHSAVRGLLHPGEPALRYSGYTMWRGVTVAPPFLGGRAMARAGWLASGKLVVYPIRDHADGTQLINWVAEVETAERTDRDWTRRGALEDFIGSFADWEFDWLDVPGLLRSAESILEYPMVDQDPLPRWSFGRITLLGDAAHPMVPRGSNGAGQAILDTRSLADHLAGAADPVAALAAYDDERRPATSEVVLLNRTNPPDAILREVFERTGDRPFERIEDVIGAEEIEELLHRYRTVARYTRTDVRHPPSPATGDPGDMA
ncbi:flavin-dependent oxidoreductase [Nocardioides hungaricus]